MTFSPLLNKNSQGRYELRHVPQLAVRGAAEFFGGWLFFLFLFLMAQKSPSPHAVSMRKKLSTDESTRSARIGGYTPRVCVVHIYELCGTVVHTTCTHMAIRARTLVLCIQYAKEYSVFFFGWPHSQEAHLPLPSQPEEAIWHNTSTTTLVVCILARVESMNTHTVSILCIEYLSTLLV